MSRLKRALLGGLLIAACAVVPVGMSSLTAFGGQGTSQDDVKIEKTRSGVSFGVYYGRPYYYRPYYRPYRYYRPYYGPYYYRPYGYGWRHYRYW